MNRFLTLLGLSGVLFTTACSPPKFAPPPPGDSAVKAVIAESATVREIAIISSRLREFSRPVPGPEPTLQMRKWDGKLVYYVLRPEEGSSEAFSYLEQSLNADNLVHLVDLKFYP